MLDGIGAAGIARCEKKEPLTLPKVLQNVVLPFRPRFERDLCQKGIDPRDHKDRMKVPGNPRILRRIADKNLRHIEW